jgi:oxazoline/thiazoline dehydrogenase
MTSDPVAWRCALAPDVTVEPTAGGALLRSATASWRLAGDRVLLLLAALAGAGCDEASCSNQDEGAALLFRLDRLGLLARTLHSFGRPLVTCVPLRPPPARPGRLPDRPFRWSPRMLARPERGGMLLEVPGSWARLALHDRALLPLLHDLAIGSTAADLAASAGPAEAAIAALLLLMHHCDLLDDEGSAWSSHDLLFHARTRRGFARTPLGKTSYTTDASAPPPAWTGAALVLPPPDLQSLLAGDPPHAQVVERRGAIRRHGALPLTAVQLSEFLFRALHERNGHRPYPSGGGCYPLRAYLAIDRCAELARGLHAYDPLAHTLTTIARPGPGLDRLLAEAAGAADMAGTPQVLLVLAARYAQTQREYGDIAYALILKEVGAVLQAAMLAAAATGLAACPLGCGDSVLFADLSGLDPKRETSVGELILGSLPQPLPA